MTRLWLGIPVLFLLASCGGGDETTDPLANGFPMAYVKRTIPEPNVDPNVTDDPFDLLQQRDANQPARYYPGGDLYIRDHASSRAAERNLTGTITLGEGDVKDVKVSYDGKRLLFSLRLGDLPNTDDEDQPTWNIWEYNIVTGEMRRIITSNIRAEDGQDISPNYLPDGRILFSSTRQTTARELLADQGKARVQAAVENVRTQQAFNLHVMDPDGSNIRQLTFNQGHDIDPIVISDGRVIFSRLSRLNNAGNYMANYYSMNPDGSNIQLLFGANSHDIGSDGGNVQFLQAKEFPDGRIMAIQRPYAGNFGGGNLVLYDLENYVDQTVTVSGGTGTASESATIMQARTDDVPTTAGSFLSAFPLWDNTGRTLVIWSQCRLVENDRPVPCTAERLAAPAFVPARPSFSIYMYEHGKQRMLPVLLPEENVYYSEVVVAQERAYPRVINDIAAAASEPGILHIRSIYDIDGTFDNRGGAATTLADMSNPAVTPASNRPARFLRLLKAVSLPDRNTAVNNARFGSSSARDGMKELIGYAPIEPDGSVKVRVPANVAFTFQIVDFRGRRLANGPTRHLNYWLQVRPGETLECGGCHDGGTAVPHGRSGLVSSINSGAPGTQFPGTDPAMVAVSNETMAETRTRISCLTDCAGLNPTMGLVFDDVWADVGSKEASFSYRFSNAYDYNDTSTRKPVSKPCDDNWTPACLAVYNYGYHIHPFWTRTRTDILGNSVTCVDAGCHNTIDPVVPGGVTLPEPMINPAYPSPAVDVEPVIMRQLNLSDESLADPSNNALRCRAYNDLVIGDLLKEVSGTILVPVEVQVTTANPNPTPPPAFLIETQNRNVGRPISGGNANGSNAFFNELENDSTVALPTPLPGNKYDHRGLMTAAEMKVLSEWIDMGAQYYNDPTSSLPNYAGCSVP